MAKFIYRLQNILDIKNKMENQAKSAYSAARQKLNEEQKKLEGEVKRVEGKLSNQGFVSKAPEKVINEEKEKMVKYKEMLEKVTDRLAMIGAKIGK